MFKDDDLHTKDNISQDKISLYFFSIQTNFNDGSKDTYMKAQQLVHSMSANEIQELYSAHSPHEINTTKTKMSLQTK